MKRYDSEEIFRIVMEKETKYPYASYYAYMFAMFIIAASFFLFFGLLYFVISRLFNCDELWKNQMGNVISFGIVFFVYYRLRMRIYEAMSYIIFLLLKKLP